MISLEGLTTKDHLYFQIRPMERRDIPVVHRIEVESFSLPWSQTAFYNELSDNQMAMYYVMEVIESDLQGNAFQVKDITKEPNSLNSIIGYVGAWIILDEAHITTIAVDQQFQGYGFGSHLIEHLISEALNVGCKQMTLEVRVSNEKAIQLYKKHGFKEAGIRKKYYSDNQEDAIIMWAVIGADE